MSSQLKDFTVTDTGPINIKGFMRRMGDPVKLTEQEAKSYAAYIKRTRNQLRLPSKPKVKARA